MYIARAEGRVYAYRDEKRARSLEARRLALGGQDSSNIQRQASRQDMRLAHKISNQGLLTFSARQAVRAVSSERKVAQPKEQAGPAHPWVKREFGGER